MNRWFALVFLISIQSSLADVSLCNPDFFGADCRTVALAASATNVVGRSDHTLYCKPTGWFTGHTAGSISGNPGLALTQTFPSNHQAPGINGSGIIAQNLNLFSGTSVPASASGLQQLNGTNSTQNNLFSSGWYYWPLTGSDVSAFSIVGDQRATTLQNVIGSSAASGLTALGVGLQLHSQQITQMLGTCVPGCYNDRDCPRGHISGNSEYRKCYGGTRTCVQCLSNVDCLTRGKRICNSIFECTTGCNNNDDCDGNKICHLQSCVECIHDDDCKDKTGMNRCSADHVCTAGCNGATDCPSGTHCDMGKHQCVRCLNHYHCTSFPHNFCWDNQCIEGCATNYDCQGDKQLCLAGRNRCVQCYHNDHCVSGENRICSHNNLCVPGCHEHQDCKSSQFCHPNHYCVECLKKSDCNQGMICNARFTCAVGCLEDSDCGEASHPFCRNNQCHECRHNDHCSIGKICNENMKCEEGCDSHEDCQNSALGKYCDGNNKKCVKCKEHVHCGPGFICWQYHCIAGCQSNEDCPAGASPPNSKALYCDYDDLSCKECIHDDDCPFNLCKGHVCSTSGCTRDEHCPAGSSPYVATALYCHMGSLECVECLSSAQCNVGTKNFCNRHNHCVEGCRNNRDCAVHPNGPICHLHECVECSHSDHCVGDKGYCNHQNKCVDGCNGPDDCSDGKMCHPGTHACVECMRAEDCPAGWCDVNNNCVPGCTDDFDCPAGSNPPNENAYLCDKRNHMCVECFHSDHCLIDGKRWCDATHTCVEGCNEDSDCLVGKCSAQTHSCVDCLHHDDCPNGWCNSKWECVPGCNTDSDCQGIADHSFEKVVKRFCGQNHQCVQCTHSDQCEKGWCNLNQECDFGYCNDDNDCPDNKKCDGGNHRCVECTHDDHCSLGYCRHFVCHSGCNTHNDCPLTSYPFNANAIRCDPSNHVCVECVVASDCPEGSSRWCDTKGRCVTGCITDVDCPSGQVCDASNHACVQCINQGDCTDPLLPYCERNTCIAGCYADTDCPKGSPHPSQLAVKCHGGNHVCVECLAPGDCTDPYRPWCNDDFSCTAGCLTNVDCPLGSDITNPLAMICDGNNHVCVECLTHDQCPGPVKICDFASHKCLTRRLDADNTGAGTPCLRNADCETDHVCDSRIRQCVECLADDDCKHPDRRWCNLENKCVAGCNDDADCPAASAANNLDAKKCEGNTHTCVECIHSDDCTTFPEKWCNEFFQCEEGCNDHSDCGKDAPVCDSSNHICVQCLQDWDCPALHICEDKFCNHNADHGRCTFHEHCTEAPYTWCERSKRNCVECLTDEHCLDPNKKYCDRHNICVIGCNDHKDCPASNDDKRLNHDLCDIGNHLCVECFHHDDCDNDPTRPFCDYDNFCIAGCNDHSDCPLGADLPGNPDAVWCDGGNHKCVECLHSDHCKSGFCNMNNMCVEGCNDLADCSSKGMVCDGHNHVCVECIHSDDCTRPEARFCNEKRVCVAGCNDDKDCQVTPAVPHTIAKPVCDGNNHMCVECLYSEDCSVGKVCLGKECVVGCEHNADCASSSAGKWCDRNRYQCVACFHDDHCASGTVCNGNNMCEEGCNDDGDCKSPYRCDGGRRACVECFHSGDCVNPLRPYCNGNMTCTPGCYTHADCPKGHASGNLMAVFCNAGTHTCIECEKHDDCTNYPNNWCSDAVGSRGLCVLGCNDHGDCTSAPELLCNQASHTCVFGCKTDLDCPHGHPTNKNAHRCETQKCVECLLPADCNFDPRRPYCDHTHTCVPGCNTDHDCATGQFCFAGTHTCITGCTRDSDCPAHMLCDGGDNKCKECFTSFDCTVASKPFCSGNLCVAGCDDDTDCPGTTVCYISNRTCVQCLHPSDCVDPLKNYCNKLGDCVAGCYTDDDCPKHSHCNGRNHVCEQCLTSDHCNFNELYPYCDPATATCVAGCVSSHDCVHGGGSGNTAANTCDTRTHKCVECLHPKDCKYRSDKAVCDFHTNKCVAGCYDDSDCALGGGSGNRNAQKCDQQRHVCVECLNPRDCQSANGWNVRKPFCDYSTKTCVAGCSTHTDCNLAIPGGGSGNYNARVCNSASASCVECLRNWDCTFHPDKKVCNLATKMCVAGCYNDSHCGGTTPICFQNQCVACRSNSDCVRPNGICTASGACTAGCSTDSQCAGAASFCLSEKCVQCRSDIDCKGSKGLCEANVCVSGCHADSDCGGPTPLCVYGVCLQCSGSDCPDKTASCLTDWQCPTSTPACDVASLRCVECLHDSHCAGNSKGKTCDLGRRKCIQCQTDAHCPDGTHCDVATSQCWTCLRDDHCPPEDPVCMHFDGFNLCVGCADSTECPSSEPLCGPNQLCVGCTIKSGICAGKGVCNEQMGGVCVGCQSNQECNLNYHADSICDHETGLCFTRDSEGPIWSGFVRYVEGNPTDDSHDSMHLAGIIMACIALFLAVVLFLVLGAGQALGWVGSDRN